MSINNAKNLLRRIDMEKIYGYKERDVLGLVEFLKDRGSESLTKVFENYALKHGKAKGTVRNLYYALAKHSAEDKEFCEKYLEGKPLTVGKIVEFNECEERQLVKRVLKEKSLGKSARKVITEISGGDVKVALRYQNKFRNALKNKPELIENVIEELKNEGVSVETTLKKKEKEYFDEEIFCKVKNEINGLVSKIALKEKKTNEFLREKISLLERENARLRNALYGEQGYPAINFFRQGGKQNILN